MKSGSHLIAFGRVLRTGLLNFVRNAWLSTAATAIMVVTLTIMLSTVILNKALGDTIQDLANDITLSIYLFDEADEDAQQQLQDDLTSNPEVKKITFISKEEAQQRYIERNKNDPELLDVFTFIGNTLPSSFEVELHDLSQNKSLVALIKSDEYKEVVEEFDEERLETVHKIGEAQRFITRSGLVAGGIFAIISILVIFNTIRMAIFTRADEITIMRLIGATNSYIRGPFLFEAMLYGIVAATVALGVVYSALITLGPKANRHIFFDPTINLFTERWLLIGTGTVLTGILIGVISSGLAQVRYMKR